MAVRRATPATQSATTSIGGAERSSSAAAAACASPDRRACCRWSITSALRVRSSWRRSSGSGSGADSRSRSPWSVIAPPARRTASMRGSGAHGCGPASLGRARADCGERRRPARRDSPAGPFRWSVSDGGWSVSGRAARRIAQRFQCAGQFGQFGQFWNHRSPSSCAICASLLLSTARSSAGRVISRPPSRPRRANHVLPDPYVLFSGQTDQTGHGQGIRGFPGLLLVSFIALVSFVAWLVSSSGESARSKVQQLAPHALDRDGAPCSCPGPGRAMPAVPARPAASRASAA